MKPGPPSPRRPLAAFTLVELLVSMVVLVLLLTVVVQMVNSAVAVTSGSAHHLDTDTQARLAFDRMAVDFGQIVKRADVDYYFKKNDSPAPGGRLDDQLAFYSETSGYYPAAVSGPGPKSNVALVGYRIQNRQLERLSKALVWNGTTSSTPGAPNLSTTPSPYMKFLPQTLIGVWPNIQDDKTDRDYQVIGESIFRMEVTYLVRNATTDAKLSERPYIGAVTVPVPYNGLRDVAAVVVSLAILDERSRIFVQRTNLDAAAAKLDDVTAASLALAPTVTPAQVWQKHVDKRDLIPALPPAAASQVRIYERYFYLGNAQ